VQEVWREEDRQEDRDQEDQEVASTSVYRVGAQAPF
jgi:hypothetical protein